MAPYIEETRVVQYPKGKNIWLKLESEQVTGSFKARGGGNKMLSLTLAERAKGVVAASTGNHGCGVSNMAKQLGVPVQVYVPRGSAEAKKEKMRDLGAEIVVHGDGHENEVHARERAKVEGKVFISPYNDADVITGQGTIGVELLKQLPQVEVVYVAVGGGGMIGGIGLYLKAANPNIEVVACNPEADPCMHLSLEAGEIVENEHKETLSEGTAGGIEEGAITFDICKKVVGHSLLVSEEDIAKAMREAHEELGIRIEGSAGVALAACINDSERRGDKTAAVIICGGNIAEDKFNSIIENAGTFERQGE